MDNWTEAAKLSDLADGAAAEVVVGGAIVALVREGDTVHALDGMCAHQGGPLGKGAVEVSPEGCLVTCPWHGWRYDARTGRQVLSQTIRQRRYPVRVEGDTIWVRLSSD